MTDEDIDSILADLDDLAAQVKRLGQPTRAIMTSTLFIIRQKVLALKDGKLDEQSPDSRPV